MFHIPQEVGAELEVSVLGWPRHQICRQSSICAMYQFNFYFHHPHGIVGA
jgi:hypothetical protein